MKKIYFTDKKVHFTVGPSELFPSVPKHIIAALKKDVLSMNHRGGVFHQLFKDTQNNLKTLLNIPKDYQIFFVSSGLESMERTIQGVVEKNSFHIITGSFGKAWAKYAKQIGKNALEFEVPFGEGVDLSKIKIPKTAELICITQNETSTGVWVPPTDILNFKKRYPEKLLALDLVSAIPYANLDFKYIDVAFFSVQKGFGLPPGMGVIIVSPKALEKTKKLIKKGISVGSYHSLDYLATQSLKFETPETPNILNIYLLNAVTSDMLKKGLNKIRQETDEKARLLYNFFENHKKYQPFVKNPKFISPTTAVLDVKGQSEIIRKKLAKFGFIVGAGYGDKNKEHIRIANFPSHTVKDIKNMLKHIT